MLLFINKVTIRNVDLVVSGAVTGLYSPTASALDIAGITQSFDHE